MPIGLRPPMRQNTASLWQSSSIERTGSQAFNCSEKNFFRQFLDFALSAFSFVASIKFSDWNGDQNIDHFERFICSQVKTPLVQMGVSEWPYFC